MGFSTCTLARDVDLLLVDESDLTDRVLPAGTAARAARECRRCADAVLVTTDDAGAVAHVAHSLGVTVAFQRHCARFIAAFAGPSRRALMRRAIACCAFAGIARPERFFADLSAAGWPRRPRRWRSPIIIRLRSATSIALSNERAPSARRLRVTTEKDAVRLEGSDLKGLPVLTIPLTVTIEPADNSHSGSSIGSGLRTTQSARRTRRTSHAGSRTSHHTDETSPRVSGDSDADRARARHAELRSSARRARSLGCWPTPSIGTHRRIARENVAAAFPARSAREHRRIVRGAFKHFGRLLFELLKFSTLSPDAMLARVEFEGEDRVRAAYAHGKGVLFVTGHFGYWELQAMVHALRLPPMAVMARALDNPALNELLEQMRTRTGNSVIYRAGHDSARDAPAAGGRGRRRADRSAHPRPRRHLRRFLQPARGDDVSGRGAGAENRRACRAALCPAARRRSLSG